MATLYFPQQQWVDRSASLGSQNCWIVRRGWKSRRTDLARNEDSFRHTDVVNSITSLLLMEGKRSLLDVGLQRAIPTRTLILPLYRLVPNYAFQRFGQTRSNWTREKLCNRSTYRQFQFGIDPTELSG